MKDGYREITLDEANQLKSVRLRFTKCSRNSCQI